MKFIVLALFLSLVGCATGYQSGLGSTSGGFYEERIAENNYIVRFNGNGFTSDEIAYDYALLRAVEIGYELGFSFMLLNGSKDTGTTTKGSMTLPQTSTTSGFVGGTSYYGTTTSYDTTTYDINKPGYDLNVLYFEDKPEGRFLSTSLFNITDSLYKLRAKHNID